MGTLLIFIGGFVGASSAAKKTFLQSWVFLVNLCFSSYLGLFLAPLIIPMLDIPGIDHGYKNVIAVFGLMFVSLVVFYKATESIFPNREVALQLPILAEKIGTLLTGFLIGTVVVTLVLYCYCQCPFSAFVTSPSRESLKESAGNSMLRMIRTVNAFSFQFISVEGERDLQNMGVIQAKKQEAAPDRKEKTGNKKKAVPDAGVQPKTPESKGTTPETTESSASAPKKSSLKDKISPRLDE